MNRYKCVIIGSGPSGYTASIYASRAGLNPVLFTGEVVGGQLTTTNDVENFPGYPKGITGTEMMEDLKNQALRFGTEIRYQTITDVDFSDEDNKVITIDDDVKIIADTVIISTGASAKYLGLDSEKRLNGLGVSACAVCDGFFYKNEDVAIVGAGDTACEEALYLANICSKVYMIVRKDKLSASTIMQNRVLNNPKIEILFNYETKEINGTDEVCSVDLLSNKDNTIKTVEIKGFFVAIGHKPNTDIFKKYVETDKHDYIVTKPKSTETNIKGVFACGDVQDSKYRQAVTASASGCMSALDAERYLNNL
jgi:thioredoxin reductase (NADPH)